MNSCCLLIITSLLCTICEKQAQASDVTLSISPESCVAEKGWCKAKLEINWQLSKAKAVCVKIEGQAVKRCFDKQLNNSTVIQINVKRPIKIQLLTAANNRVLASSTLNVLIKEYQKRSRQRHAWSVIQ
ncbi:DUF3019 domain-containing protein [Colwellia sp. 12G3]|uniref:DUF3019 domain-containing protein n=1 Tax=Colwellia sp. 12G3 TaxID=2058299 RepID=UPI000C349812|nr:DUF3019 domain-containing protein [Colwellia sp. 12G3]PKI13235.1 hypothetical protein CXF71_21365 [Colwellia sp. 12G3]